MRSIRNAAHVAAAFTVASIVIQTTFADPTGPGYYLRIGGSQSSSIGGAFAVTPLFTNRSGHGNWSDIGYSVGSPFNTFCVENVVFHPGSPYWATIDNEVYSGAVHPIGLTAGTKNVYAAYATGSSFGSDFGANGLVNTAAEMNAVQAYFWLHEGVFTPSNLPGPQANAWNNPLLRNAILGVAGTSHTRAADVRALNLWYTWNPNGTFSGDAQSQLIMVPAPTATVLGAIGLGLLVFVQRRLA